MPRIAFDKRITHTAFVAKLVHDFGSDGLSKTPHREETIDNGEITINLMTLYYNNDKHIGTWMKGKGWIFQSAYNSVTA